LRTTLRNQLRPSVNPSPSLIAALITAPVLFKREGMLRSRIQATNNRINGIIAACQLNFVVNFDELPGYITQAGSNLEPEA
jgi:hypothetical protein